MKHTKGPWIKEQNPTIQEKIQIAAFAYDGNRELQIIVRSNNVEDDLNIIASAPELLEALKSLCDWSDGETRESAHSRIDTARAAIAKAEWL